MIIADKETRLGIYAIDNIVFFLIVIIHSFILDTSLTDIPDGRSLSFAVYLVFVYLCYHFLFEYFFQKTPGKFLTNTLVVDDDGNKPDTYALLRRTLSRLIPFDNLSFLIGHEGWHDSVSKTKVVHF